MAEYVLVRGWVCDTNASGQKCVQLMANNADGIRFWTEDKSLIHYHEAENIVACIDCKYCEVINYIGKGYTPHCHEWYGFPTVPPLGFCYKGERKDDG